MAKHALFLHGAGPQGPNDDSRPFARWLKARLSPEYNLLCPSCQARKSPIMRRGGWVWTLRSATSAAT